MVEMIRSDAQTHCTNFMHVYNAVRSFIKYLNKWLDYEACVGNEIHFLSIPVWIVLQRLVIITYIKVG